MQKYLKSSKFSNYQVEMLFKLRSRNIDVKSNFKSKYKFNNILNLQCRMINCFEIEDQEHILKCKVIISNLSKTSPLKNINYNDLFSNTTKQKRIVEAYIALLDQRESMLN